VLVSNSEKRLSGQEFKIKMKGKIAMFDNLKTIEDSQTPGMYSAGQEEAVSVQDIKAQNEHER
jgi:hypothetical protein